MTVHSFTVLSASLDWSYAKGVSGEAAEAMKMQSNEKARPVKTSPGSAKEPWKVLYAVCLREQEQCAPLQERG